MRKQYITKILTGTLVVALFTGCGLSNTAGDTVSDGTVSGSAVSGGAVAPDKRKVKDQAEKEENKATEVKNCLANDDNQYHVDGDGVLLQSRLDGSHEKRIKIKKGGIEQVCWVTNEWIYYLVSGEKDTLYRIPIKKTEQGDSLLLKRKEAVITEYCVDGDLYVTDTFIVYCMFDDKTVDEICKLDLRTQEKKVLMRAKNVVDGFEIYYSGADARFPLMKSGKLFLYSDEGNGAVWLLDPETEELKRLAIEDYCDIEVWQGKIWFVGEENIYLYDEKKEEAACVLSQEQLRELLVQEGIIGNKESKREVGIDEVWYYQGRFYLSVFSYTESKWNEALFSFSLQSPEDIRNERTASDFIQKLEKKDYWYDDSMVVKDGKMLLCFLSDQAKNYCSYAVYDLNTKEIQRISEKEADRLFPE